MNIAAQMSQSVSTAPAVALSSGSSTHAASNSSTHNVTYETLAQYFEYPLNEASAKMGIPVTKLKVIYRAYNIKRWPYRKLLALKQRRQTLQMQLSQLGGQTSDFASLLQRDLDIVDAQIADIRTNQHSAFLNKLPTFNLQGHQSAMASLGGGSQYLQSQMPSAGGSGSGFSSSAAAASAADSDDEEDRTPTPSSAGSASAAAAQAAALAAATAAAMSTGNTPRSALTTSSSQSLMSPRSVMSVASPRESPYPSPRTPSSSAASPLSMMSQIPFTSGPEGITKRRPMRASSVHGYPMHPSSTESLTAAFAQVALTSPRAPPASSLAHHAANAAAAHAAAMAAAAQVAQAQAQHQHQQQQQQLAAEQHRTSPTSPHEQPPRPPSRAHQHPMYFYQLQQLQSAMTFPHHPQPQSQQPQYQTAAGMQFGHMMATAGSVSPGSYPTMQDQLAHSIAASPRSYHQQLASSGSMQYHMSGIPQLGITQAQSPGTGSPGSGLVHHHQQQLSPYTVSRPLQLQQPQTMLTAQQHVPLVLESGVAVGPDLSDRPAVPPLLFPYMSSSAPSSPQTHLSFSQTLQTSASVGHSPLSLSEELATQLQQRPGSALSSASSGSQSQEQQLPVSRQPSNKMNLNFILNK